MGEIKFSKIGTLGPTPSPSLNEIGEFFKKQLVDKVKNWFNNNIKWKTFTLKLPTGITFKKQDLGCKIPTGIKWKKHKKWGIGISLPDGMSYTHTLFGHIPIPNGLKFSSTELKFPVGFGGYTAPSATDSEHERLKNEAEAAK